MPHVKLFANCPGCKQPLVTDELAPYLAWCVNEECKFFIKRYDFQGVQLSLCFSIPEVTFLQWAYVDEKELDSSKQSKSDKP